MINTVITEMQIKPQILYYYIYTVYLQSQNMTIKGVDNDVEKLEPTYIANGKI